jgi:release factor glutamine methyltransferase
MQTIADARMRTIEELKRASVESPTFTADLLLGFVLGWDRVHVLCHPEQLLDEEASKLLEMLLLRRAKGEPLQYLTGEKEFYGHLFRVTPDVLIPRPETEILVEKAIELIRSNVSSCVRFADIGAGSGCIAISVACEIPSSFGYAVDISAAALGIARYNALQNQVGDRVLPICGDLLECFPPRECLDLVMSNPPYIPLSDYNSLPTEVSGYEPHLALFGGESGLDFYRRLIPESMIRLVSGGYLLLELGAGQAEQVTQLVRDEGFLFKVIVNDLQGIPRCLIAQKSLRSSYG